MGNKAESGKGGSTKKGKGTKFNWIGLNESEKEYALGYLENFFDKNTNTFQINKFIEEVFPILDYKVKENIYNFLNSFYKAKKFNKTITNNQIETNDMLAFIHILIKSYMDMDEDIYFDKSIILILYDLYKGKVKAFEESKENMDFKAIKEILTFIILSYYNKYTKKSSHKITLDYKETFNEDYYKDLEQILLCNIFNENKCTDEIKGKQITLELFNNFLEKKLPSIGGYVNSYLKAKLFNKENDESFANLNAFPLFSDPPSTMPVYKFFLYCLSNPLISSKPYAFKLYDCKVNGFNLSNLVYSFLGFNDPILIILQHLSDKNTNEFINLGMYINGNFKECFSNFCGDDSSHIVVFGKKLDIYKTAGDDKEHLCYISSKNKKFQKMEPGIGMGYSQNDFRFWIDANSLFSKSHFNKYDDVFEDGSPFEEMEQKLDIMNLEVYGFGNDDTLQDLMKKQERDKTVIDKLKKIDKSSFVNNEFDREMFFSKTFAHRESLDERAVNEIVKKDEKEK